MAELFKVNAPVRKPLFEGVQGENEARSIQFDITPWVEELGDGAVTATAKRSQDSQPYPVTVIKDSNTVTWKPTSTDTAFAGVGSFQLEYTVDDVLAKTCIWSTMVAPSLDPAGDPPDPYDNWLAEMREIEASAIQAADDAEDSADAAAASAAGVAGVTSEVENIRIGADGTTYASAGDAVRGQVSDLKTDLDEYADIFTGDVDESVKNWLDEHPEATTTVEDGSLTLPKFKEGELPFVTPEQFGAKGDGVTDDTTAWQSAVDSGYNVRAMSSAYKCGQIVVTKNITIDCNGATFNCTANKLFNCVGEVVTTLTNESDYTANQPGYSITNLEYSNYTGIAMLKGTNNYEKSRDYYRGGFVCEFFEGVMTGVFPIDVTTVSIEIINPVRVDVRNIGDVNQNISNEDYAIYIEYGFGCTIKDSNIKHSGAYVVIELVNCLNCIVDNCNIVQSVADNPNHSYLVALSNSSFCAISNCYLYNKHWHCISTGAVYLCYHNIVDSCKLYSDDAVAYEDHENALNSIVKNSICGCIGISGMGVVENCNIISINNAYRNCTLRVLAMSNKDVAVYTVKNVKFLPASNANANYVGVILESSSRVAGNTYYITECKFDNVKCENNNLAAKYMFGFSSTSTNIVENIIIDNSNFMINFGVYTGNTYIDITNYELSVFNCISKEYDIYYPYLGESKDYSYNTLHVKNCKLGRLRGTYVNAYLNDVDILSATTGTGFIVTGNLFGSNIRGKFQSGVTTNPANVRITDFQNAGAMLMNLFSSTGTKKYYQYYNSNGTLVTEESLI